MQCHCSINVLAKLKHSIDATMPASSRGVDYSSIQPHARYVWTTIASLAPKHLTTLPFIARETREQIYGRRWKTLSSHDVISNSCSTAPSIALIQFVWTFTKRFYSVQSKQYTTWGMEAAMTDLWSIVNSFTILHVIRFSSHLYCYRRRVCHIRTCFNWNGRKYCGWGDTHFILRWNERANSLENYATYLPSREMWSYQIVWSLLLRQSVHWSCFRWMGLLIEGRV